MRKLYSTTLKITFFFSLLQNTCSAVHYYYLLPPRCRRFIDDEDRFFIDWFSVGPEALTEFVMSGDRHGVSLMDIEGS